MDGCEIPDKPPSWDGFQHVETLYFQWRDEKTICYRTLYFHSRMKKPSNFQRDFFRISLAHRQYGNILKNPLDFEETSESNPFGSPNGPNNGSDKTAVSTLGNHHAK